MNVRAVLGELELEECDAVVQLVSRREQTRVPVLHGLREGDAVATLAHGLNARWVVHVVSPAWSARTDRSHVLATAYRSCLQACDDVGARHLAMPPLGSRHPYWPTDRLVSVCLGTLFGSTTGVSDVRLVLTSPVTFESFTEALARR